MRKTDKERKRKEKKEKQKRLRDIGKKSPKECFKKRKGVYTVRILQRDTK